MKWRKPRLEEWKGKGHADLVPEAVDGGVPLVSKRPPLARRRLHEERRRVLPAEVHVHPRVEHRLI